MEYGRWELRDDGSYYLSKDARIYPSSNATDIGKLHTEENVRQIYRDLVGRNFVNKYNYFSLSVNANRDAIIVAPGECVIQGYHFYASNTIEVKVPVTNNITEYTLCISLVYDAANHVTGDVVNKDYITGQSEVLSGVYLAWFDECHLECYYDNLMVLGRCWAQNGKIVADGTVITGDRIVYHGFEPDPFKDHKYQAEDVEIQVHGHKPVIYDTLRDNMTEIHTPIYTYDSMHFPIELDRQERTKPPTIVTDIQDYVNHIPDWYISKYGDYMTGGLRFNNLSIDALREFENVEISKDGITNKYGDSVFISPRTYGDLVRDASKKVENKDYDYDVGGTVMSIVPGTYDKTTDDNSGYTGIHSALVSQKYGEAGLRIHGIGNNNQYRYSTTRIVHYNENDDGQIYDKTKKAGYENTSKFIMENLDDEGRQASINIKNGEIFIDSFESPNKSYSEMINDSIKEEIFNGNYKGSGIQFYVSSNSTETRNNLDFRIDEYNLTIAEHNYQNHRLATRGNIHNGTINDTLHFDIGLGITYDSAISYNNLGYNNYTVSHTHDNANPYFEMGNLRFRSNDVEGANVKQNTIEVLNIDKENSNKCLPYIRIKPRTYSEQYLAEELIQVGTTKYDDYFLNNAEKNTLNRIVLKRVGTNGNDSNNDTFTYLEQDFRLSNGEDTGLSKVFVKMRPPIGNKDIQLNDSGLAYDEIAGIYSAGNIGCSTGWLETSRYDSNNSIDYENSKDRNNPYADNEEWVRFTRFRYDNDKDQINGGTYDGKHEENKGRIWGSTYNIEFNTTVSNRSANQIIWRYNGSTGTQNEDTLDNTPPVVLSYIHDNTETNQDNTETNQGTPTRYTNWDDTSNPGYNEGRGTFETWRDHNGIQHFNPTYKVRDFLHLENAGLVVHGDINNPSQIGDSLNTNNHFGVTILAGRVYNSVYNDFAETFEKNDKNDKPCYGSLISANIKTGKYEVTNKYEDVLIVGVLSNSYAYLAGGNRVDSTKDIIELENEYYTVALCGKVWVNVIKDSNILPGDLLTSSFEKGKACKSKYRTQGTIIGKALCKPKYFEDDNNYKVLILVMNL